LQLFVLGKSGAEPDSFVQNLLIFLTAVNAATPGSFTFV